MSVREEGKTYGYKVVKDIKKEDITDIEELEEIIKKGLACRVGFIVGDEPYIAPTPFGYERNALYFHADFNDQRAQFIRMNNKVCFEITTGLEIVRLEGLGVCSWMTEFQRVMGKGRAVILEDDEEKSHGLNLIVNQYAEGDFVFPQEKLDITLVVKVEISSMAGIKRTGY